MTKTFCDVTGCKNEAMTRCEYNVPHGMSLVRAVPLGGNLLCLIQEFWTEDIFHICEEHSREYRERKNKR